MVHKPAYYRLDNATRLALRMCGVEVQGLLTWIESKINKQESVEMREWAGDWWRVTVYDHRVPRHHCNAFISFTMNIKTDEIMWCNHTASNPYGGNCFLRSLRWYRLLRRQYPFAVKGEHFRDYRKVTRKRDRAA